MATLWGRKHKLPYCINEETEQREMKSLVQPHLAGSTRVGFDLESEWPPSWPTKPALVPTLCAMFYSLIWSFTVGRAVTVYTVKFIYLSIHPSFNRCDPNLACCQAYYFGEWDSTPFPRELMVWVYAELNFHCRPVCGSTQSLWICWVCEGGGVARGTWVHTADSGRMFGPRVLMKYWLIVVVF